MREDEDVRKKEALGRWAPWPNRASALMPEEERLCMLGM